MLYFTPLQAFGKHVHNSIKTFVLTIKVQHIQLLFTFTVNVIRNIILLANYVNSTNNFLWH